MFPATVRWSFTKYMESNFPTCLLSTVLCEDNTKTEVRGIYKYDC